MALQCCLRSLDILGNDETLFTLLSFTVWNVLIVANHVDLGRMQRRVPRTGLLSFERAHVICRAT